MQPVRVVLDDDTVAKLEAIAIAERRRPADQAAVLLTEAIANATARSVSSEMNELIRAKAGRPRP